MMKDETVRGQREARNIRLGVESSSTSKQKDIRAARYQAQSETKRQEQIRESVLASVKKPNVIYTEERQEDGTLILKAKPQMYFSKIDDRKSGTKRDEAYFVPHEIILDVQGNILKEIERQEYQVDYKDKSSYGYTETRGVYDTLIKEYEGNQLVRVKDYQDYSSYMKDLGNGRDKQRRGVYLAEDIDYKAGQKTINPMPEEDYKPYTKPISEEEKPTQFFISPEGKTVSISKTDAANKEKVKELMGYGYIPREQQTYSKNENPYQQPLTQKESFVFGKVQEEIKKTNIQQPTTTAEFASSLFQRQGKQTALKDDALFVTSDDRTKIIDISNFRYGKEILADVPSDSKVFVPELRQFIEKQERKEQESIFLDIGSTAAKQFSENPNLQSIYVDGEKITREEALGKTTTDALVSEFKPDGLINTLTYQQKQTERGSAAAMLSGSGLLAIKYPIGFIQGAKDVIFHPVASVKSTVNLLLMPFKGQGFDLYEDLMQDPTELGRMAGQVHGASFASKLYFKAGKIAKDKAIQQLAKTDFAGKLPDNLFRTKVEVTRAAGKKGQPTTVEYGQYQKTSKTGKMYKQTGSREVALDIETVSKVKTTRVEGYWKNIKEISIAEVENIKLKSGQRVQWIADKGVYIQEYVKPKIRTYKSAVQPFEIEGLGVEKVTISGEGKTISASQPKKFKATIDVAEFKLTKEGAVGLLKQNINRMFLADSPTKGISSVEKGLVGDAQITKVFDKKTFSASSIFGLDTPIPVYDTVLQATSKTKPVLSLNTPPSSSFYPILFTDFERFTSTERKPSVDVFSSLISETDFETKQKNKPIIDYIQHNEIESSLANKSIMDTKPVMATEDIIAQKPIIDVLHISDVFQFEAQKPVLDLDSANKEKIIKKPTAEITAPMFYYEREKFKQDDSKEGYDVFSRVKRKQIKLNKQPLTKQSALSMGARYTDQNAAVTFQLKESEDKREPLDYYDSYYSLNAYKFRDFSKKDKVKRKNFFVEKEKYRFDSIGEQQQITKKGQAALRRKSLLGNFNLSLTKKNRKNKFHID